MDEELKRLFPIAVSVEAGKTYLWCGCGESKTQPLCNKDHVCAKSVSFLADISEEVIFCNCKQTKNPPWCDGSHAKLVLEVVKRRQQMTSDKDFSNDRPGIKEKNR